MPSKLKAITIVSASKVRSQTRAFSVAQRPLSTEALQYLLPNSKNAATLSIGTYPRRLSHCGEQKALPSGPTPPHGLFPRPSSVPLHDCSRANDFCTGRARSEATISRSGRSRSGARAFRATTQYQFCQGDRLYTSQSALKGTELHGPVLGFDAFIKEDDRRRQQQRQREEEENIDDSDNNDNGQPQREADTVVGALTVIEGGRICPSRKKEGSARPGKRQRSPLPSSFPILKPDQKEAGSHSDDCSDELGITHIKSDEKDRRLRSAKRERPSLSNGKPAQRERQHHLQQQSPRQPQARLTAQWHCAKIPVPLQR